MALLGTMWLFGVLQVMYAVARFLYGSARNFTDATGMDFSSIIRLTRASFGTSSGPPATLC